MFSDILNKYNPKDSSSHGVLKYFSENLTENESILFVEEILQRGSWKLPTEISRSLEFNVLKHKTTQNFHQAFNEWVKNRIEYSSNILPVHKNPYITQKLQFEFNEAILSIKNLGFPENSMLSLEKLIMGCSSIYLQKFLKSAFRLVKEEYEEADIEKFLTYFINLFLKEGTTNLESFLHYFLNTLAFSHKIYNLSDDFLNLLNKLSLNLSKVLNNDNYKRLISLLLIELILEKKLDLSKSKYNNIIKETIDNLDRGSYFNLVLYKFLKRFNYSFSGYNVSLEIESLFKNLSNAYVSILKKNDTEKQGVLHHFIKSSNEYFELLLFCQELSTEHHAKEYLIRFIEIIDNIRESFSSMLWYDEYLNFIAIPGRLESITKDGFDVKIDPNYFQDKSNGKKIESQQSKDFAKHFGIGYLPKTSLNGFPKTKFLFNSYVGKVDKSIQINTKLDLISNEDTEEINKFYISGLNYSSSNKKSVLILTPYRDIIDNVVSKYQLRAFFSVIELYLIENANRFLSVPTPFNKKSITLKLLLLPNYINSYKISFSESTFWEILEKVRPHLYNTLYVKHKEVEESITAINIAYESDQSISGIIKSKSKGGLIVEVLGIDTFLPGSHIDIRAVTNYDEYIGRTIDLKVIKVNKEINNIVVSRKALLEKEYIILKNNLLSSLHVGQIIDGKIKNIVNYGVFIDLNGLDGFIYKSDLAWYSIVDINDFVKIGDSLKVIVLDFDRQNQKVTLGLKQLTNHPWEKIQPNYTINQKVRCKINNITNYGIFIEIIPGVEGLVHLSEISWKNSSSNLLSKFKIGDIVDAIILTLDHDNRKMSLSFKRLLPDPWIDIYSKFPIGSTHTGIFAGFTKSGIIVELTNSLEGLIPISELKMLKKYSLYNEYTKTGNAIDVTISGINEKNRKINLNLINNKARNINKYSLVFIEGSVHKGTIISIQEFGALVSLVDGPRAFCPKRHLVKKDKSKLEIDEMLDFKIIEVDWQRDNVIVSHTCSHDPLFKSVRQRFVKKSPLKKNGKS